MKAVVSECPPRDLGTRIDRIRPSCRDAFWGLRGLSNGTFEGDKSFDFDKSPLAQQVRCTSVVCINPAHYQPAGCGSQRVSNRSRILLVPQIKPMDRKTEN
jgi:hypothetical protein